MLIGITNLHKSKYIRYTTYFGGKLGVMLFVSQTYGPMVEGNVILTPSLCCGGLSKLYELRSHASLEIPWLAFSNAMGLSFRGNEYHEQVPTYNLQ